MSEQFVPQPGEDIEVRDASDNWLPRRACTTAVAGMDFAVVWVCRRENWQRAQDEGLGMGRTVRWEDSVQFPWPAEDVRPPQTQETPQGHEIPVPTRGEVERDLRKLAGPAKGTD